LVVTQVPYFLDFIPPSNSAHTTMKFTRGGWSSRYKSLVT